jgi:mitogen-activated protein kinase kinase 1
MLSIILLLNSIRYKAKNCPYICGFHDAFYRNSKIHILLEYMDGNSLQDLNKAMGAFPEPILAFISLQVLRGLHYLHNNKKIIHRDMYLLHFVTNLHIENLQIY